MATSWQISVHDGPQLVYSAEIDGSVQLGRQSDNSESPYACRDLGSGLERIVIAPKELVSISRMHALLEPLPDGSLRITNISRNRPIVLVEKGLALREGQSCLMDTESSLNLGERTVRLQPVAGLVFNSLAEPPLPPGEQSTAASMLKTMRFDAQPSTNIESMTPWIKAAMGVLQSAAGSQDFFARAAQALVNLVGLDSGRVLLWQDGDWQAVSVHRAVHGQDEPLRALSRQILGKVYAEKKTFWWVPKPAADVSESLRGLSAVVATPILDPQGEVIGALYGERQDRAWMPVLTEPEALLVELLAGGVAAGLARLEQEKAAAAARVQFEQFFTPELARQLTARPDLLNGRDADVTVLFCDISGFSRITERLGPAQMTEWLGDVLGMMSDCVMDSRGVVVDYIGDAIMALWGAPGEQPDHARAACQAALQMLARLPELNARWQQVLGEPAGVSIGLCSGAARVGNVGSRRKFKYGALGDTVNVASRVQGATKYLKAHLLITAATQAPLGADFATRRLAQVRVMNIEAPVTVYELVPSGLPHWPDLQERYEKALTEFEAGNFRPAAGILGGLVREYRDDGPSLVLLHRAVAALVEGPAASHPVWVLGGK